VIAGTINIMQDRITRSRMAGDPPDIILEPRLRHLGLLEFYRAQEAIDEGLKCVSRMKEAIHQIVSPKVKGVKIA
jgi:NTE family protein